MKAFKLIFLAVFICTGYLQAQTGNGIARLHDQLVQYFRHRDACRIYLITDKDVYKPGESIRFSAISAGLPAEGPVAVPGLKISLRDADGQVIASEDLPAFPGISGGALRVPPHLQAGKYALVAHLPDIRNENETFIRVLFLDPMNMEEIVVKEQEIPQLLVAGQLHPVKFVLTDLAGNSLQGEKCTYTLYSGVNLLSSGKLKTDSQGVLSFDLGVPEGQYDSPLQLRLSAAKKFVASHWIHVNTEKVRLSFFAEGGRFIAGLPLKIGFRAVTADGQPVEIAGSITGSGGRQVSQAKTLIAGYGMFPIVAQEGEQLNFKITGDPGKGQTFELPEFNSHGLSLSVPRTDPEFIHLTLAFAGHQSGDVNLILSQGDSLLWAAGVKIDDTGRLRIPRAGLPGGLCLLSAFDPGGTLLAERMLYRDPAEIIRLEVTPAPGEDQSGNVRSFVIRATPAAKTDSTRIIVSVSADVKNLENADDFLSYFMLNSFLEHRIPGTAILGKEQIVRENILNYLLISNKIRNFPWQPMSGFSVDPNGQPAAESGMDLEQRLSLYTKHYIREMAFVNKPEVPESFFSKNPSLYTRLKNTPAPVQKKDDSYLKYLRAGSSVMEAIKMIKPYQLVDGDKIVFPGGNNSLMAQDGAMIVLDGQKLGTSASALAAISPYDVESISVSTSPVDISRYTGLNSVGLIEICTRRGDSVQKSGEVKEPAAEETGTTLYWSPSLYLNNEGEVRVTIPATDIKGDFQIRVVAIDRTGRTGQTKGTIRFE